MIIERAAMHPLNSPHFRRSGLLLLLSLACVNLAFAGGFWIELENPAVTDDPKAQDAVLIVHATLCQNTPVEALLTATAEGSVDGKPQSLPLEPLPLYNPRNIRHSAAVADRWHVGLEHRRYFARQRPRLPSDRRRSGPDRTGALPRRHRQNQAPSP